MKPETFFDNFEVLAEAPNGVKKLRELILQLAVRGKLVAQDSNDEPASVLLEKIEVERKQQLKEKKIKKIKTLFPIEANEAPYEKPESWVWCRLGEIIHISSGDFLPSDKMSKGGQIPVFGGNGITGYHDQYNVNKPTLVIGRVGFYCGSLHITPELAWITDNAFSTYFSESHINFKFLYWLLKGSNISIRDNATAQPVISGTKIYPIIIGLPPLKEQKRIVTKVDKLMSLCDELEARQQKKRESRACINSAALGRLLTAPTPQEFAESWRRISDNFDLLYDAPENVGSLRKAILQFAVMGKLVQQDPNDEPASVLAEKVKAEKERLFNKKKIRNKEVLPHIEVNDLPYNLPNGWAGIRLGECIDLISGQHLGQDEQNDRGEGIPYLTGPADFGEINPVATRWTSDPKVISEKNDILITVKGAGVGKANILGLEKAAIGRQLMAIRPIFLENMYIYLLINASLERFQALSIGSTVPGIGREDILRFAFGLPPLAEQRRIIARVDQLTSLCDELEASLARSHANSERLMEAVVSGVVGK